MHTCACFMHIYECFHRICCLTSPHTSIQKGTHKGGGGAKRRPPLCGGGAKRRPLSGWMCVGW